MIWSSLIASDFLLFLYQDKSTSCLYLWFNSITSAGLRSLRWLNVKQRFMVNDVVMMHKCLQGLSPSYLSDKFSTRVTVHNRQSRYRNSLNVPQCRITAGQRAFYYRGVKIWNNLSKDLNTKAFKRHLIKELTCDMN